MAFAILFKRVRTVIWYWRAWILDE